MEKLNFEGKLSYQTNNGQEPEKVFQNIADELKEATKGYIVGVVNSYNGPINSYITMSPVETISKSLGMETRQVNIQSDLGEIGFKKFKFEFYLTTPCLEEYKYRILFFEYGIGGYPVKIVLEQGIADEIFMKENVDYILERDNERGVRNIVYDILQTKKVINVMQDLINASNFNEMQSEEKKVND